MKFHIGQLVKTKQGIGKIEEVTDKHFNIKQNKIEEGVFYFIRYENGSQSKWKAEHLLKGVK